MKNTPLYLMGFILLTFAIFGCRKQMQVAPSDNELSSFGLAKKDSSHPGDTIRHDTIRHPGDTIPHYPGDTTPHHPVDTPRIPVDTPRIPVDTPRIPVDTPRTRR